MLFRSVPIPVQGNVEAQICGVLDGVFAKANSLGLEALVLARGGGSREDLAVFDGETLARCLSRAPIPVVTGIGHEDDTTVADLVADHRAATPTAALVALLPERRHALANLQQLRRHLGQLVQLRWQGEERRLEEQRRRLLELHPRKLLDGRQGQLALKRQLLQALSPSHLLQRGFSVVRDGQGRVLCSVQQLQPGQGVLLQLRDGEVYAMVGDIHPSSP